MNQEKITKLTALSNELEELLKKMMERTVALMSCENEEITDMQTLIDERQKYVDELMKKRAEVDEIINEQDKPTAEILTAMFSKNDNLLTIPSEMKELRAATLSLRSQHSLSSAQEEAMQKQFQSRYDEIKQKLVSLNSDKKKIQLMSNINGNIGLGSSLDNRF